MFVYQNEKKKNHQILMPADLWSVRQRKWLASFYVNFRLLYFENYADKVLDVWEWNNEYNESETTFM